MASVYPYCAHGGVVMLQSPDKGYMDTKIFPLTIFSCYFAPTICSTSVPIYPFQPPPPPPLLLWLWIWPRLRLRLRFRLRLQLCLRIQLRIWILPPMPPPSLPPTPSLPRCTSPLVDTTYHILDDTSPYYPAVSYQSLHHALPTNGHHGYCPTGALAKGRRLRRLPQAWRSLRAQCIWQWTPTGCL